MTAQEFKETVMPLQDAMYRAAFHITGNRDDACDAIQDTLVSLWKHRSALAAVDNKAAYWLGALKNQCLSLLRRARPATSIDNALPESGNSDCITRVETADTLRLIRSFVSTMPPSQKRVFELSAFAQCSNVEISRITGMSETNIRAALSRSRKRLKTLILKAKISI